MHFALCIQHYKKSPGQPTGRDLFIRLGVIGQTEKIIHRNTVQFGKLDQNIGGDIPLTQLVVAVYLLRAVEILGQMPLLPVPVFP